MPRKINTNLTDEQKKIYKDLIDKQKAKLEEENSESSESQTKKARIQTQQPQEQTQSKIPLLSEEKIDLNDEEKNLYSTMVAERLGMGVFLDTSEATPPKNESQTQNVRTQTQQPQEQTQFKIPLSEEKIDLSEEQKKLYSTMVAEKLGMSNSRGVFKNYLGSDGAQTSNAKKPTNPQSESRKSSKRKT